MRRRPTNKQQEINDLQTEMSDVTSDTPTHSRSLTPDDITIISDISDISTTSSTSTQHTQFNLETSPQHTQDKQQTPAQHWSSQLLTSLRSLRLNLPPDCHVIVNTHHIPVHRTVLYMNSSLGETASFNQESGVYEVRVEGDQVRLVTDILGSFYTGELEIEHQNLESVYRFAKSYSVGWLQKIVWEKFAGYITAEPGCARFVEIFKFAHTVWCTQLVDLCISTLDNTRVMSLLAKPDLILQLDFFSMRSITTSSELRVEEKWVFKLVNRWFKEVKQRDQLDNCHLGYLLTSVQYHLIDKPYLHEVVFDLVLDSTSLEDGVRRMLLKKIRDAMKYTDENQTARNQLSGDTSNKDDDLSSTVSKAVPKNQRPIRPDNLIRKIVGIMAGNIPGGDRSVSANEIDLLLSEKYQNLEPNIQDLVVDYLATRDRISGSNCTRCLQLYGSTRNRKLILLVVNYLTRDPGDYNEIYGIGWGEVSFETIRDMIQDTGIAEIFHQHDSPEEDYWYPNYRRFPNCTQVELIMSWSVAHPNQTSNIASLLNTLCYRSIPSKYRKLVLLPFVRLLLSDKTELKCGRHKHKKTLSSHNYIGAKGPRELYDDDEEREESVELVRIGDCRYNLDFSEGMLKLTSRLSGEDNRDQDAAQHKFILFDALAPTETTQYPLFTCNLSLARVRETVGKSSDVFVMFVKRRGMAT
ncbi:hypothetical protein ACHWQZ_G013624 [Mnemiopsis leidyi]